MPQVAQCSAEEESFTYRWYKTQWSRLSLNISSSHSPLDSWWCSDDMSRPPQLASSLLVSVSIILFWENIIKSICSLTRLILNCLIRLRSSEVKETIQNIILKIEKSCIFISYLARYLLCTKGSKWGSKGGKSYIHFWISYVFFLFLSLLARVIWAIIAAMELTSENFIFRIINDWTKLNINKRIQNSEVVLIQQNRNSQAHIHWKISK